MRYIRLFNEDKWPDYKNDYYVNLTTSISEIDIINLVLDNYIKISHQSIAYIRNLFHRNNPSFSQVVGKSKYMSSNFITRDGQLHRKEEDDSRWVFYLECTPDLMNKDRMSKKVYIYELQDEYYVVNIVRHQSNSVKVPSGYDTTYKCDQLDGIKELLKDMKIIK